MMSRLRHESARGFTLVELLFALALAVTLVGISVPVTQSAVEEIRGAAAARHLAERIARRLQVTCSSVTPFLIYSSSDTT